MNYTTKGPGDMPEPDDDYERSSVTDKMVETNPEFCPENIWTFSFALRQVAGSHDSRTQDPVAQAFEEARKGNHRLAWTLLSDVVMAQCRANAEDALHDAISIRDQALIEDEQHG